jgi:hypothetical protein
MKTAPPFDAEGRFHSLAGGMSGTGSGQQIACGTMSLAALEPLMPEVNVRCVVIERDRHGRLVAKVFSPNWGRHRPQVGLGGVGAGVPAVFEELRRRRGRGSEGQARDVAGHLRETLGVARIVTAAAHAGNRFGYKRRQGARHLSSPRLPMEVVFDHCRRC